VPRLGAVAGAARAGLRAEVVDRHQKSFGTERGGAIGGGLAPLE
jgi:hypothetical protein